MAQELKLIPRDPNYFNPFTDKAKHKVSELRLNTYCYQNNP
jgi:hypothetical protein